MSRHRAREQSSSDTEGPGLPAAGGSRAAGLPDTIVPGFAQSQRAALAAMICLANSAVTTPADEPARALAARRSLNAARPAGRAGLLTAQPQRSRAGDATLVPTHRYGVPRKTGRAISDHPEGETWRSRAGARSVSRVIALIPAHNEATTIRETGRASCRERV